MLSLPGLGETQRLCVRTGSGTSPEERAGDKSTWPTASQSRAAGPQQGETNRPDTGGEEAVGQHARGSDWKAGESDPTDANREETVFNLLI